VTADARPRILSGQHKLFVRSADGLNWIVEPGAEDGYGPHHAEQEPAGNSVHDFIMGLMPRGGVFLDIGAHVGHYTLRAARVCEQVIAFEANPASSARLLENLALNSIGNVVLMAMAAWDRTEVVHLAHGAEQRTRSGGMRVLPEDTGTGIRVPAIPVDHLTLSRNVGLIKIDTEGGDLRVLAGMRDTIRLSRPVIVVEDHSRFGYYTPGELREAEQAIGGYTWHDIAEYGVAAGGAGLGYRIGRPGG
jgi:FkbM family methyltransferase